jgi:ferredoxin-NADP reductase
MTAAQLLTYISGAVLLQVLLAAAFALWKRSRAVAPTLVDAAPLVTKVDNAWSGWRDFRVSRRAWEDTNQSQCSFYLEPVDGVALKPFKPGQFLTFSLQVSPQDSVTRCYSLSYAPHPQHYRITVKRAVAPQQMPAAPPGVASSYLHDHVQVGDVLQVRAPSGHFYLHADEQVPVVLIGGGIGITPMMSMLAWSLQTQPDRVVHLFYGVRNGADHAFKQVLESIEQRHANVHLHVVYSRPNPSDTVGQDYQHKGHIDVHLIKQTLPHGRHQFYICGSAPMMESLVPALAAWGVQRSDLHFEAFGPASVRLAGDAVAQPLGPDASPVEIHFAKSGRTLQWQSSDGTLLDFAEQHGIAMAAGCRAGGCGCCETRVTQGEVRYDNPPDYDAAPGHCLPCVARPATATLGLSA